MQQERLLRLVNGRADVCKDVGLLGVERMRCREDERLPLVRIAVDGFVPGGDEPLVHQRRERGAVRTGRLEQRDDGHGRMGRAAVGRSLAQRLDDGGLFRRAPFQLRQQRGVDLPREPGGEPLLEADVPLADHLWQHRPHGGFHRATVIRGHPAGQAQQVGAQDRAVTHHFCERADAGHVAGIQQFDHRRKRLPLPHGNCHARAGLHARFPFGRNRVIEGGPPRLIDDHTREFHGYSVT